MMKKLYLLFLLALGTSSAFAQTAVLVTNDGTTGTTVNETAIVNSTLNAIAAGTGNTAVPAYIVVGGAGTTGQAQLATSGPASCVMDSTIASAAGWYFVINSPTTAKDCHAQSAAPSAGTWVIGYLSSTSTTSGSAAQVVVSPYVYGGSSSSMTGSAIATAVQSLTGCNTSGNVFTPQASDCVANSATISLAANTIAGNNTGSTANAFGLTVSQLQAMLFPAPGNFGGTTPGTGNFTTLTAQSLGVGSTPPTAMGSATGIWACAEASTAGTPTSAQSYIRCDSTTHTFKYSLNGSSEASLPMAPFFPVNSESATYQVLAADFASCKTITVPSGTFTVTLVASGSQPTTGQCVDVINYGTGVVSVARSGQNINGGTSSLTLAAGSATAPTGAHIVSDGTNYEAALWGASSGGSITPGTYWQTPGFANGVTTVMTQNTVWCAGVILPPGGFTVGHMVVDPATVNGTNDIGVYPLPSSGTTATLAADVTPFTSGIGTVSIAQGTVTINSSKEAALICATSNAASPTIQFNPASSAPTWYTWQNTGIASSGGALPSTITVPAASPNVNGGNNVGPPMLIFLP